MRYSIIESDWSMMTPILRALVEQGTVSLHILTEDGVSVEVDERTI